MPVYIKVINNLLKIWFKIDERIRFLLVGGYNTLFAFLLFCLLEFLFRDHFHYLIILFLSHIISVLNSFITFRFFVFRSQGHVVHEYIKINIVYLIYYLSNAALLYLLHDLFHINILISQFTCICILMVATYTAHKHFSFKKND
jgi:putative flippase GtrA